MERDKGVTYTLLLLFQENQKVFRHRKDSEEIKEGHDKDFRKSLKTKTNGII
jgi:hypothetical protein